VRRLLFALSLIIGIIPDVFAQQPVINQAAQGVAVTPSDTTVLSLTKALYNGGGTQCAIAVLFSGSSTTVTFSNVQPGEILPYQVVRVMAATTCTGVVALY